jgi:hypothetical protein
MNTSLQWKVDTCPHMEKVTNVVCKISIKGQDARLWPHKVVSSPLKKRTQHYSSLHFSCNPNERRSLKKRIKLVYIPNLSPCKFDASTTITIIDCHF